MEDLTVIIPAYNEDEWIRDTIFHLQKSIKSMGWKILVVNDGSTDNTGLELKKLKDIEIIEQPYNKGYGASLKAGILKSTTELIAFYDADGQHRPEDLIQLYNGFKNFDMLVGERGKDSHHDWIRKPGKWVLSKTANFLTGRKIPDLNSGLRIIKRSVIINMLHLFPQGFSFSTTSTIALLNMGFNVGYRPIVVNKRKGISTVKQLKHGSDTLLLILRLIVLFNPLKVFIPTSLCLITIGLLYEIIFGIILLPGGVKLIPAAFFLLITGVLIFFFGLVVDQISELRKHLENK